MSEPFVAEIRLFPFDYAPRGWALCNGQSLPIAQNQALFALLGTTFGGNGQTTFNLPDLRGRTPMHPGSNGIMYGQASGEEAHTLVTAEMPAHNHLPMGDKSGASSTTPENNTWAAQAANPFSPEPDRSMHPTAIGMAGGSQPHTNMQPYLVLNFCIALKGIYPSRD